MSGLRHHEWMRVEGEPVTTDLIAKAFAVVVVAVAWLAVIVTAVGR